MYIIYYRVAVSNHENEGLQRQLESGPQTSKHQKHITSPMGTGGRSEPSAGRPLQVPLEEGFESSKDDKMQKSRKQKTTDHDSSSSNRSGTEESVDRNKAKTSEVPVKLVLKHVFGYEGNPDRHGSKSCEKNVMFVNENRIIFPSAALVVVMDTRDSKQGFFTGHTDDVSCMAVHPDRTIAASGQTGKYACIMVWSTSRVMKGTSVQKPLVELPAVTGIRTVCSLNFSGGDGKLLVAIGMEDSHTVMVYNWKACVLIASSKIGHSDCRQISFNPYLFWTRPAEHQIVKQNSKHGTAQSSSRSPQSSHGFMHSSYKLDGAGKEQSPNLECFTLVSYGGKSIKFWTLKSHLLNKPDNAHKTNSQEGRKVLPLKLENNHRYDLEGSLATTQNKGGSPELTSMIIVNDTQQGNPRPQSRIFTGTSSGHIFIWQQLEEPHDDSSNEEVEDGGPSWTSWLGKGRLLSVVAEAHDSPIIDMEYITSDIGFGNGSSFGTIEERIASCSMDGIVNMWKINRAIEDDHASPMEHLGALELGATQYVRSISWSMSSGARGTKKFLAFGTVENSILLLQYREEKERIHTSGIRRRIFNTLLHSFYISLNKKSSLCSIFAAHLASIVLLCRK